MLVLLRKHHHSSVTGIFISFLFAMFPTDFAFIKMLPTSALVKNIVIFTSIPSYPVLRRQCCGSSVWHSHAFIEKPFKLPMNTCPEDPLQFSLFRYRLPSQQHIAVAASTTPSYSQLTNRRERWREELSRTFKSGSSSAIPQKQVSALKGHFLPSHRDRSPL